jgi:hypothetical protein
MREMKGSFVFALALSLCASVASAQYTGPWTHVWDFNNGQQGWILTQGSGYWVDPGVMPDGPTLPDGGPSGAGAGNLYAPDGTRFQIRVNPTNSFVVQVDAYLPNLMPLNINAYLPGNGLQNAGVGAITQIDGKHMYVAGRNPDGVKTRDHSWDSTEHIRSWLFEEAGVERANMWDKWVTLQFVYNLHNSGKYSAYVYTPFDSGVHDGPGWYAFGQYDIHPNPPSQFVDKLIVGSVVPGASSWTQAQFDNVKFFDAVPEPASMAVLAAGLAGFAGTLRRRS